jgi:hypothetical protein
MTLNKDYIIYNKPIKELLNDLDIIIINLSKFGDKYKYRININKNSNGLWNAEINVNNEKSKIKAVKTAIEPPTLL